MYTGSLWTPALPCGCGAGGLAASWRPVSVSPRAADFARTVVGQVAPGSRERAKSLLWAAGKLADYAIGLGLEPVPQVLLHPSVIERFAVSAPGLSGPARRTLRTNLRFLARRVVPALAPADAPLPRCARSFKMRMLASLPVRMCGREEAPPAGCWRGRGVRGGVVVVSLP